MDNLLGSSDEANPLEVTTKHLNKRGIDTKDNNKRGTDVKDTQGENTNIKDQSKTLNTHIPINSITALPPTQTSSRGIKIFLLLSLGFFAALYIQYCFWDPFCMFDCKPFFGISSLYNRTEPVTMCPSPAQGYEREVKCRRIYPNGTVEEF